MMKIILLNPHLDALQDTIKTLQRRGVAVLVTADALEAWQILQLHGNSVELAVVHREMAGPGGEGGFQFISKVKKDEAQADLPIILTSERWGDVEFVRHQKTAQGANAYLKYPYTADDLFDLIQAVIGALAPSESSEPVSKPVSQIENVLQETSMPVLEEAAPIFNNQSDQSIRSTSSIHLDAPELDPQELSRQFPNLKFPPPKELKPEAADAEPLEPVEPVTPVQLDNQAHIISVPPAVTTATAYAATSAMPSPPLPLQAPPPTLYDQPYTAMTMPSLQFAQPVGDAVVPGGAAQSPDLETLKKYLLLREQDVAVLSGQLKAVQVKLLSVEEELQKAQASNAELQNTLDDQKHKLDDHEKNKVSELDVLQTENTDLKFQLKVKSDKSRVIEGKMRDILQDTERLKERVRADIRRIGVREKELENRLEIMKKDSEALIGSRENRIVELKRKLDLLEFNMDLLKEQNTREKDNLLRMKECIAKANQAVRVANRILEGGSGAGASDSASSSDGSDEQQQAASAIGNEAGAERVAS